MDGWVIIGTKLDTKDLEKELSDETKKLAKYEKEHEVLIKAQVRLEKSKAMKEYEQLRKAIEKSFATQMDNTAYMGVDKETEESLRAKLIEKEKEEIVKLNEAYSEQFQELKRINSQIEENNKKQELAKSNIENITQNLEKSKGYDSIKNAVDGIGKSTENVIKKVAKWGLAIFGIRSAYMLIRQSISTLSQYNEKLANDIQGIRLAIANALAPVVEWIINLIKKLIGYLAYIIKAWTGRNIFASTNKGLKSAEGTAKKLQKTLAGFDEMNVIQDSSAGGSGGGTSGASQFDIPDKVPALIEFIATHGKEILAVMTGLVAGLTALKLGAEGITALGIGVLLTGIVLLIQDIIAVINDPSWQNFVNILGDIAIAVGGIMLITGNWWGLLVAIAGAIVKLVADNWDAIVGVLSKVGSWIYDNVISPVANFFTGLWNGIKTGVSTVWNAIVSVVSGVAEWVNNNIIQPVGSVITDMWNGFVDGAKFAWEGIKSVFSTVANFFKTIFTTAWTAVKNVFSTGGKIFDGIKDGIVTAFKTIVNAIINGINKVVAIPFNAINTVLRKIRSISILGIEPFSWVKEFSVPKIPTLAVGGIINQPGRGVAIGGERGAEGVIPLTNTQQMQRLGEAIGRYITVNTQMNNYMNGRLISRELQQIQNEEDFAFNGG